MEKKNIGVLFKLLFAICIVAMPVKVFADTKDETDNNEIIYCDNNISTEDNIEMSGACPAPKGGLIPLEWTEVTEEEMGTEGINLDDFIEQLQEIKEERISEGDAEVSLEECADEYFLESMEYDHSFDTYANNYVYNHLDDNQKALWLALDACCNRALTTTATISTTPWVEVSSGSLLNAQELTFMFKYSNPQYFFLSNGYYYYGNGYKIQLMLYASMQNGDDRQKCIRDFKSGIDEFKSKIDYTGDEAEIAKSIHDVICDEVIYNKTILNGGSVNEETTYTQSAYSALVLKDTVCSGFSQAYEILCNDAGIDCIAFTSPGHAYNKVKIFSRWYNVDITWDNNNDKVFNSSSKYMCHYLYFLKSDSEFAEQSSAHIPGEEYLGLLPECNVSTPYYYGYYRAPVKPSEKLAKPTVYAEFSSGKYFFTITSENDDADIYYTMDGTSPSESFSISNIYKTPIEIPAGEVNGKTIKAFVVCDGYIESDITEFSVVIRTLQYKLGGGTNNSSNPTSYIANTSQRISLYDPVRTNYDFLGWYDNESFNESGKITEIETNSDKDYTLYAKWAIKEYVVRFNADGGNVSPEFKNVIYNEAYGELPVPEKVGYQFDGWYTALNGGVRVSAASVYRKYEDSVLYARWSAKDIVVRFNALDGYIISGNDHVTKKYGYTLDELPQADHEEKNFDGWYTEANGNGIKVDSNSRVVPVTTDGSEMILYAYYTESLYKAFEPTSSVSAEEPVKYGTKLELSSKTSGAMIFYTVNGSEPSYSDYMAGAADTDALSPEESDMNISKTRLFDEMLVLNEEIADSEAENSYSIVIKAFAKGSPSAIKYRSSDVVTFNYTVIKKQPEYGDISEEDRNLNDISSDEDIPRGIWVANIPKSVEFTGKPITFDDLRVYYGKYLLEKDKDYSILYRNNIKASEAASRVAPYIQISGKGSYQKSIIKKFTITPRSLGNVIVTGNEITGDNSENVIAVDAVSVKKKGAPQKLLTTVMYKASNGETVLLKNGIDYSLFYPGTVKTDAVNYDADAFVSEGEYKVLIKGKGNYGGNAYFKEIIIASGSDKKLISGVRLSTIKNQYITDGRVTLSKEELVLKDGKYQLREYDAETGEGDYILSYENNDRVGTATVFITAAGDKYEGTLVKTFKIDAIPISKAVVNNLKVKTYTGNEITQEFSDSMSADKAYVTYKASRNDETVFLREGVDYDVKYFSNINAGRNAFAIICGRGRFKGEKRVYFTIAAYKLNSSEVTPSELGEVMVTKRITTPKLEVRVNGKLLTENVDYRVRYTNNNRVSNKLSTAEITGIKNYCGTVVRSFTIVPSSLEEASAAAGDIVYRNQAGICKPVISLYDTNGVKLVAGIDYDTNIKCFYRKNTNVRYAAGRNSVVDKQRSGNDDITLAEQVDAKDIVPAGAELRAVIRGKGNYAGSTCYADFRVVNYDIAKAVFTVNSQNYNGGNEVRPDKNEIKGYIRMKPSNLIIKNTDYEIVSYSNNIKSGTGKITIRGVGIFGGEKTIIFKINRNDFL